MLLKDVPGQVHAFEDGDLHLASVEGRHRKKIHDLLSQGPELHRLLDEAIQNRVEHFLTNLLSFLVLLVVGDLPGGSRESLGDGHPLLSVPQIPLEDT